MDENSSPVLEWSSVTGNKAAVVSRKYESSKILYSKNDRGRLRLRTKGGRKEMVCHKAKGQSSSQCAHTMTKMFVLISIFKEKEKCISRINPRPLFETICPPQKGHDFGLCLLSICPPWMHSACTLKCSQQAFPLRRFAEPDWISFKGLTASRSRELDTPPF